MYYYMPNELPELIEETFPVSDQRLIFSHSMGGRGDLLLPLRNLYRYKSILAFSPICNPVNFPWSEKAFGVYLCEDRKAWGPMTRAADARG